MGGVDKTNPHAGIRNEGAESERVRKAVALQKNIDNMMKTAIAYLINLRPFPMTLI
jgi:hypothetical protein